MIDISQIDLNLLVVFVTLMKTKNVTKASKELHITQPAISHSLKKLRDTFENPLFISSSKGLEPTYFSYTLHPHIENALNQLSIAFESMVDFDPQKSRFNFVIYSTSYFEMNVFPKVVSKCLKEAPHISVQCINYSGSIPSIELEKGMVDFAIGFYESELISDQFECVSWFPDQLVCVTNKDTNYKKEILAKQDLSYFNYVYVTPFGEENDLLNKYLESEEIRDHITIRVQNYSTLIELVEETNLLIIISSKSAEVLFRHIPHKVIFFEGSQSFPHLNLISHKQLQNTPARKWMKDLILNCGGYQKG